MRFSSPCTRMTPSWWKETLTHTISLPLSGVIITPLARKVEVEGSLTLLCCCRLELETLVSLEPSEHQERIWEKQCQLDLPPSTSFCFIESEWLWNLSYPLDPSDNKITRVLTIPPLRTLFCLTDAKWVWRIACHLTHWHYLQGSLLHLHPQETLPLNQQYI